jgi:tRNA threonylcarbamoyl adenosine modification protein YeaZ
MVTLVLHLATDPSVIALYRQGKCLIEQKQGLTRGLTEALAEKIAYLCRQVDLTLNDLSEIVVTQGPGGYTSTRVAITVVKMMALTLNIPIKMLSTLEAWVWDHRAHPGLYLSILETRWPFHMAALFRVNETGVEAMTDNMLWEYPQCLESCQTLSPKIKWIGSLRSEWEQATLPAHISAQSLMAFADQTEPTLFGKVQPIYAHPPV